MISESTAKALVPPDVAALDAGLAQAVNSLDWLDQRGYVLLPLGVSDEVASGWAQYDGVLYGGITLVASLTTVWVVLRRRPG